MHFIDGRMLFQTNAIQLNLTLQSRCRNISARTKRHDRYLRRISSLVAKGLNTSYISIKNKQTNKKYHPSLVGPRYLTEHVLRMCLDLYPWPPKSVPHLSFGMISQVSNFNICSLNLIYKCLID